MLEPWSQTEDFVFRTFLNRLYRTRLRIEKLDAETGEQILHDEAVFALYKADRNEEKDGDGAVKRYESRDGDPGKPGVSGGHGSKGDHALCQDPGARQSVLWNRARRNACMPGRGLYYFQGPVRSEDGRLSGPFLRL